MELTTRGKPAPWKAVVTGLQQITNTELITELSQVDFFSEVEGETDTQKGIRIARDLVPIVIRHIDVAIEALVIIDGTVKKEDLEQATFAELLDWVKKVVNDNKENYTAVSDFLSSQIKGTEG